MTGATLPVSIDSPITVRRGPNVGESRAYAPVLQNGCVACGRGRCDMHPRLIGQDHDRRAAAIPARLAAAEEGSVVAAAEEITATAVDNLVTAP